MSLPTQLLCFFWGSPWASLFLMLFLAGPPWLTSSRASTTSPPVKVFIFAGQSNMVGSDSNADHIDRFPPFQGLHQAQSEVRFWYCLGREQKQRSEQWVPLGPVNSLVGPELSFAAHLREHSVGSLAIIKCAAGGTHLGGDWNPDQPSGFKMYPLLLDEIKQALGQLQEQGVTYQLEGVVWHQGENDMFEPHYMARYGENLTHFMRRLRNDLSSPTLPFFIGELCTKTIWGMDLRPRMAAISRGQQQATQEDPLAYYVRNAHVGVEMGQPVGLHYHYGTLGQLEQGVEFAEAYLQTIDKGRSANAPLKSWPFEAGDPIDLFILAGHRNMEGEWSFVQELQAIPDSKGLASPLPSVAYKYWLGGGVRASAGWEALAPSGLYDTFGPEVSFGYRLRERVKQPLAILKFTHSGSQIIDWSPEGSQTPERNLYPKFVSAIRHALQELRQCGHEVRLAGIFYHLGENDMSFAPYRAKSIDRLERLMVQTRSDLALPDLRWYVSQQAPTDHVDLNDIDVTGALAQLAEKDAHLYHVPVFDLPGQDRLLFKTSGILQLGRRLADAYLDSP